MKFWRMLVSFFLITGLTLAQSVEERIKALEKALDELKAQIAQTQGETLQTLQQKIQVLERELERLQLGEEVVPSVKESFYGLGPAASKVYQAEKGVSLAGYGEMVYQHFNEDEADELDLLRGVFYVGYKFSDQVIFNSEIEFEHAGEEVGLEFAYVDYLWKPALNLRAGLMLVPLGIINEYHEPTVFLGALRPKTERVILPTTWRENGVGIFGAFGSVNYKVYVINGFKGENFSAQGFRKARQKGSEALAEDFALVTRWDWNPTPGFLLGASYYRGDASQTLPFSLETQIWDLHLVGEWGPWELRGLWVEGRVENVEKLNAFLGLEGVLGIGKKLQGGYLQVGYDLLKGEKALIPFIRWERVNPQEEVASDYTANPSLDETIWTYGFAYKPMDQLIIKVDFQAIDNPGDDGVDQFNVGLGYIF